MSKQDGISDPYVTQQFGSEPSKTNSSSTTIELTPSIGLVMNQTMIGGGIFVPANISMSPGINVAPKQRNTYIQLTNPISYHFTLFKGPVVTKWNQSLFTNNAQVYYKPGSLSIGGVGTTRNSRAKGYRT